MLKLILATLLLLFTTIANSETIVLLGDSYLETRYNKEATNQIASYMESEVLNTAIGGSTTKAMNARLETLLSNGFTFPVGSIAIIDIGLPDFFIYSTDSGITIHLDRTLATLKNKGVKVILSEAPLYRSADQISLHNKTSPAPVYDSLTNTSGVVVYTGMVELLRIPHFIAPDRIHLTPDGFTVFNLGLAQMERRLVGKPLLMFTDTTIKAFIESNFLTYLEAYTVCGLVQIDFLALNSRISIKYI